MSIKRLNCNFDEWISQRVPPGGLFHPQRVTYSKDTQDLLKLLMAEQKMTMFQQKKVDYYLRNGVTPKPSCRRSTLVSAKSVSSISDMAAASTSSAGIRRSLDMIKASGAYDFDKWSPPMQHHRENCETSKLLLQEQMSGLKHFPECTNSPQQRYELRMRQREALQLEASPSNRIGQLLQEIFERSNWLNDMEALGEGRKHRATIHEQIRKRMLEIKQIEKDVEQ